MSLSSRPSRAAQRCLLASTVVLGGSLFAAPAFATTASVVSTSTLNVQAAAGETNSIKVTAAGTTYTVEDAAGVTASTGCVTVTSTKATCTSGAVNFLEVYAGNNNDTVDANVPFDTFLAGEDGDDSLRGVGSGQDSFLGGNGTDLVNYDGTSTAVHLSLDGSLNDGPVGGTGDYLNGVENLRGGSGNDTISGGSASAKLEGGSGADTLTAGAGGGTLNGGAGNDTLNAGTGYDRIDYTTRTASLSVQLNFNTVLVGGSETDTLSGTVDQVLGGYGDDEYYDDGGSTYISGGPGADYFALSGGGDDIVVGEDGNDQIVDGAGDDIYTGGNGDDTIRLLAAGSDGVYGNAGTDTVDVSLAGAGQTITLDNVLNDGVPGAPSQLDSIRSDVEKVIGTSGDDTIIAGSTSVGVTFEGRGGNDTLTGKAGNDALIGGAGVDALDGGDGNDTLTSKDGVAGDTVIGGNGTDSASGDTTDIFGGVETITY